jgi:hypothetical protein
MVRFQPYDLQTAALRLGLRRLDAALACVLGVIPKRRRAAAVQGRDQIVFWANL